MRLLKNILSFILLWYSFSLPAQRGLRIGATYNFVTLAEQEAVRYSDAFLKTTYGRPEALPGATAEWFFSLWKIGPRLQVQSGTALAYWAVGIPVSQETGSLWTLTGSRYENIRQRFRSVSVQIPLLVQFSPGRSGSWSLLAGPRFNAVLLNRSEWNYFEYSGRFDPYNVQLSGLKPVGQSTVKYGLNRFGLGVDLGVQKTIFVRDRPALLTQLRGSAGLWQQGYMPGFRRYSVECSLGYLFR